MEIKEVTMIRRLVPRVEYLDYFKEIGGKEENAGHFVGQDWEAYVGESCAVTVLTCTIEEVVVTILAREDKIDEMVRAFRLKFMRAGA